MILQTTQLRQLVGVWRVELPAVLDDLAAFSLDNDITARKVKGVVRGSASPSVVWVMRQDSDRSAAGTVVTSGTTSSTTTGDVVTSFNNDLIPSGAWVWVEIGTVSGVVFEFNLELLS